MQLDKFLDQYARQVFAEVETCRSLLEVKDFEKKSDFTKVQGKLQGLQLALALLKAMPDDE